MPEIRFTEEDQLKIDQGLGEIERRFDPRFGEFRERLNEDDLNLVKAYVRDVFYREALALMGLESLYDALATLGVNGDRKEFVGKGMDAVVEAGMRADRTGLFERMEDENDALHKKLELTPLEEATRSDRESSLRPLRDRPQHASSTGPDPGGEAWRHRHSGPAKRS